MTSATTYGVLGVGSIARAIVIGLCDGVPDAPRIVLSPRGAAVSAELAGGYPTVSVAATTRPSWMSPTTSWSALARPTPPSSAT